MREQDLSLNRLFEEERPRIQRALEEAVGFCPPRYGK